MDVDKSRNDDRSRHLNVGLTRTYRARTGNEINDSALFDYQRLTALDPIWTYEIGSR